MVHSGYMILRHNQPCQRFVVRLTTPKWLVNHDSLFKGKSPREIVVISAMAMTIAIMLALLITWGVSLLPISGTIKGIALCGLGLVSCGIGYFVLIITPATSQKAKPATNSHITLRELYKPSSEINKIFVHSPATPNAPIANSSPPRNISINTISAFILSLLKRILHRVL